MDISVAYYSEKGKRPVNEDAVSILESNNGTVAIVADGLGGHEDGEIASHQAVETINGALQVESPNEKYLVEAICKANQDIYIQQNKHMNNDMRTTVAVLWMRNSYAVAANVGDSRIYQFRNGEIIYQSLYHSVAQMAVLVGELDKDQICYSEDRNRLIRTLGNATPPKVDSMLLSVQEGDCFLLCSDGFWEAVTEKVMLEIMQRSASVEEWLASMQTIIDEAENPQQDNHSVIVISVKAIQ